MTAALKARIAQHTSAGAKTSNEDSCGILVPELPLVTVKGMAAVIADGMSGSEAGKEASDLCVQGFLNDYFSTPESWSVKTSGEKVLTALNRWLYGRGHAEYGSSRGLVTTLSALVVKSATAYLFHVGDTRIYRLRDRELECLTRDHRMRVGAGKTYLSRAMGIELLLEIDYRSVSVRPDDIFLLTTDGLHDFVDDVALRSILLEHRDNPESAVQALTAAALDNGSDDNVTCQCVRIVTLPNQDESDFYSQLTELPFPPPLEPGMILDGYRILRECHASKRTQVYLAVDGDTGQKVVIKTPSVNFEDDADYIDQFLHEEWAGRRVHNTHVLRVLEQVRPRQFLYYVTEHVEGQTLRQWMRDHPRPGLSKVRNIVEQIAAGLRAFHRMEMIHQDLKPENVMIDTHGIVKIIDFGSVKIAGIAEIATPLARDNLLGTVNYTAPEYLMGYAVNERADIYSLGVITYELLTGKLPYGEAISPRNMNRVSYQPLLLYDCDIPIWVDAALEKAVARQPDRRYAAQSEFIYDLSHPNPAFVQRSPSPLLERNPLAFWRGLAIVLGLLNVLMLYLLTR